MDNRETEPKLKMLKNFFKPNSLQIETHDNKEERKRKTSNTFQRVSQKTNSHTSSKKEINMMKQKIEPFKMKVQRKDTSQTRPTVTDNLSQHKFGPEKTKQISELYQQAKHDPFLKRKLNSIVSRDLKAIVGTKKGQTESLNRSIDDIMSKQQQLHNVFSFITDRYVERSDVSIRSEQSIVDFIKNCDGHGSKNNSSMNSNVSETSMTKRLHADFIEQDERVTKNNEKEIGNSITTFRKQNFKTRIGRIEVLRKIAEDNEKQSKTNSKHADYQKILKEY